MFLNYVGEEVNLAKFFCKVNTTKLVKIRVLYIEIL